MAHLFISHRPARFATFAISLATAAAATCLASPAMAATADAQHATPRLTTTSTPPATAPAQFRTIHTAKGSVMSMASGAPGELFISERTNTGVIVEQLYRGKWYSVPAPGEGMQLSSASSNEVWATNTTNNAVLHFKAGVTQSFPMPQAEIDEAQYLNDHSPYHAGAPFIDGVADIPGDGAVVAYRIPFSHGDMVDLYKVTDGGVTTKISSASEAGGITYQTANGKAYLSYSDRYQATNVQVIDQTFAVTHPILTADFTQEGDPTSVVVGGGQLWMLTPAWCSGTATLNPSSTCVTGSGVETARGTQVLRTADQQFKVVRQPATAVPIKASSPLTRVLAEPGTDNAWGVGTQATGTTVIERAVDISTLLPA